MARIFATDIAELSYTLGVGSYLLDGAREGYRSFGQGYDDGDTPYYVVRNNPDTKYEHNKWGLFSTGTPNTLARAVTISSNGGAPVDWEESDHPLNVYVPGYIELMDDMIRQWWSDSRSDWLKFGHWFDSGTSPGYSIWKIYDGVADVDITVGTIDHSDGTLEWQHAEAGSYKWVAYAVTTIDQVPGYLRCLGEVVAQADYPKLYAKIGTDYNTGDEGEGNFRLPDMRSRTMRCVDNGSSLSNRLDSNHPRTTLGATGAGGAQYHLHSVSITVSVSGSISGTTFGSHGLSGTTAGSNQGQSFDGGGNSGVPTNHTHNFTSGVTTGDIGVTGSFSGSGSGSSNTNNRDHVDPYLNGMCLISTGGQ